MYALKTSNKIHMLYLHIYSNKHFNSDNNITETLEKDFHVNGNSHNYYPSQMMMKGNFCEGNQIRVPNLFFGS